MKKLILILLFSPIFLSAQEYSEIVDMPGKTIDQLYSSAREWFALTFKSANDILKMDDPIAGKIIGNGSTILVESYTAGWAKVAVDIFFNVEFIITISLKENKYKAVISDIYIKRSYSVNSSLTDLERKPYADYIAEKGIYKNKSNPENTKSKENRAVSIAYYNLICKTEDRMKSILKSLESKMKKSEENW